MNKTDLLAKLLASENIDIIRAGVSTASFDIVNRVLTLPQWQDMTDTIEIMLKAHEVGHALFSPIELLVNDSKTPKSYINVIEDVRIERKIKSIFPGLRKDFIQGYKELNDRDFFKIANQDLSKLNLINRINLYFKAGSSCGVTFNKQEMVFVERAKTCDTVNDVMVLSEDIYVFSKADYEDKKAKQQEQQMSQDPDDSDEEYDNDSYDDDEESEGSDEDEDSEETDGESDEESDGEKENEDNSNGSGEDRDLKEEEEALEVTTQEAFDDNLGNLADTNLTIINHTTDTAEGYIKPIISYKKIMEDLELYVKDYYGSNYQTEQNELAKEFRLSSSKYVNYLVKEFEMKKSAKRYARTTISRTGGLNVNKLYAHTISDNLFKSISTVTDDKNHGMIFLLDWSGSMANVMADTLKQVINLAMFCQRSSISYQVLAFSSSYASGRQSNLLNNTIDCDEFRLLELFSNKMSNSEFNKMIGSLLSKPWYYAPGYRLGNTPLNVSLLYMVNYIEEFTRNNNIEKTSLVVLTDGISNRLYIDAKSNYGFGNKVHKLRDTKTKKTYDLPDESNNQTQTLLKIIKDRYNIPIIGFHLASTSKRDIYNFCDTYMIDSRYRTWGLLQDYCDKIRKAIRVDNVFVCENSQYDELYFIPSSTKVSTDKEMAIESGMNSRSMAKHFSKFLNIKKSSRVVLDKFIRKIA
jgi:hypothetical protein